MLHTITCVSRICANVPVHIHTCWNVCIKVDVLYFSGVPNIIVTVTGGIDSDNDGMYDVMMGNNFNITCMLSCPTATVTWRQNNTDISVSPSQTVTIKGFSVEYTTNVDGEISGSVLTRNMAELSDSAMYECATTVQSISLNDMIAINVYGKYFCLLCCLL